MIRVKVCGITTVEQALACAALGVDAIGINLIPSSPRCTDVATATAIVQAIRDTVLAVGVIADLSVSAMHDLRARVGFGCLQLCGNEPVRDLEALLPNAYKVVRVANHDDVVVAQDMPGEFVMVDAKVKGKLGGTGKTLDWGLVVRLAQRRKLLLAGGLTPENVAAAAMMVQPWCVDVASGVESAPGVKDFRKVKAFVAAARGDITSNYLH